MPLEIYMKRNLCSMQAQILAHSFGDVMREVRKREKMRKRRY